MIFSVISILILFSVIILVHETGIFLQPEGLHKS
jgi:hypothetical protein